MLLVVLVVSVLVPPLREEPPVVEVLAVPELAVPPPVAAVLLEPEVALELEPPEPAALEFEPELALEPVVELVDDELLALLDAVVCAAGVAALVVGTVSGGAPVVSVLPLPLPPQAASASAASRAAAHPIGTR